MGQILGTKATRRRTRLSAIIVIIAVLAVIGVGVYFALNGGHKAPTLPEPHRIENVIMTSAFEIQTISRFEHKGDDSREVREWVDYYYGNDDGNLIQAEIDDFLTDLETMEREKIETEHTFIDGKSGHIVEVNYWMVTSPLGDINTPKDFVLQNRCTISWTLKEKDEHTYSRTGLGYGDVIYFSVPTGWEIESVDGLSSESMSPDQRTVTGVAITDTVNITFRKPEVNEPPTASASANPTSGEAPLTVSFTGSGADEDGTIESYYWDFDDGTTSNKQNPTHTFNNEGTYNATFTVTDDKEATGTDKVTISVSQARWIKRMRYTAMTSYYYGLLDLYSAPHNRHPDEFIENYYIYNEVFSNAFDIQGNKLKIEYAAMGSSDGGALSIFVYEGSTDTEIHWEPIIVYLLDEGSFEVNVDPGTYYLIFGTEYMEYVSVDVYDWS